MRHRLIIVLGVLVLLAAIGFALGLYERPEKEPLATATPRSLDIADKTLTPEPAPDIQFLDKARLTVAYEELPKHNAITLALSVAADSISNETLPVRVVAVDGRVFDTVASPAPDNPSIVSMSIDSQWLTQGSYMIQLKTQERTALPLRRYVLIIN